MTKRWVSHAERMNRLLVAGIEGQAQETRDAFARLWGAVEGQGKHFGDVIRAGLGDTLEDVPDTLTPATGTPEARATPAAVPATPDPAADVTGSPGRPAKKRRYPLAAVLAAAECVYRKQYTANLEPTKESVVEAMRVQTAAGLQKKISLRGFGDYLRGAGLTWKDWEAALRQKLENGET